jgi:triphosphoribosyl-dephospho-CoA synthase
MTYAVERQTTGAAGDAVTNLVAPNLVATAAQLACLLEVSAPKPGNVSPGQHFADTRYEHFLASAAAIGLPLSSAGARSLGATVLLAVDATNHWTRSNTNLGIVLLLAPLARAALLAGPAGRRSRTSVVEHDVLRTALRGVLDATTVEDAHDVYAAIRRAAPGGLGRAAAQDVADAPTITLLETMRLAEHRDGIAREYVTQFATTFECGAPALLSARREGLSWDDAVVETFLTMLAVAPDTHIVRRAGSAIASDVSRQARAALAAGGVRSVAGRRMLTAMDAGLREATNATNPGTTADLTAASIFVVLLGGGWHLDSGGHDATTR